jgi:hypothetical protein
MIVEEAAIADEIAARRLKMLVEQYAETRQRRYDFISVAKAQAAILQLFPEGAASRETLDRLIVECAVAHGLTVHFDGSSGEHTYDLVERITGTSRNDPDAEIPL